MSDNIGLGSLVAGWSGDNTDGVDYGVVVSIGNGQVVIDSPLNGERTFSDDCVRGLQSGEREAYANILRGKVSEVRSKACAYDKIPEGSLFSIFSENNPHVESLDRATFRLVRESKAFNLCW